ncbi:MAG: sporulation regulator WhiA [delta proteobacterium ML8_F1]|nr:MAG: sporulation regulator WhiA [delta proteobacterium ML8_F1]
MSFTSKIKNDLSKITQDSRKCQKAELSGIIRSSGIVEMEGFHRVNLTIRTENAAVARMVFIFFKKIYNLHTELLIKRGSGVKRGNLYEMTLEGGEEILLDLGIIANLEEFLKVVNQVPEGIFEEESCLRAYIRGVFLGCGSVSNPEKSYHLEFSLHSEAYAGSLMETLNGYDLGAKMIPRKTGFIVYIKESEKIVDLLNIIGAHTALLDFENVRILKDMRNRVNRLVNCETANLNKTVNAAYNQIAMIKALDEYMGLDQLPEGLRLLAELRLENPDMSLKELGEAMDPAVGKSGVNHRFKKMENLLKAIHTKE